MTSTIVTTAWRERNYTLRGLYIYSEYNILWYYVMWWIILTSSTLLTTVTCRTRDISLKLWHQVTLHACMYQIIENMHTDILLLTSSMYTHSTCARTVHEQSSTNYISLKKLALDHIQSHPLHRTHFGQYQASSAALEWLGDGNCYHMCASFYI